MDITIKRTGGCNRCGHCCSDCRHLTPQFAGVEKGKYICTIYEKRDQYCQECGTTHSGCIEFPRFPIRDANSKCGYRFLDQHGVEVVKIFFNNNGWRSTHED